MYHHIICIILFVLLFNSFCVKCDGDDNISPVHADLIKSISLNGDYEYYRKLYFQNKTGSFYVAGVDNGIENANYTTSLFLFSSSGTLPLSYNYAFLNTNVTSPLPQGSASEVGIIVSLVPTLIIEYEESNGIDGYQLNQDKVLGWVRLESYGPFSMEISKATITTPNNMISTTVYTVDATSPNKLLTLRFIVSGSSVNVSHALQLSPDQSKVDITIRNYYDSVINERSLDCNSDSKLFSCNSTGPSDSSNSRLALASFFLSSFEIVANLNNSLKINGKIDNYPDDVNIELSFVDKCIMNGKTLSNVTSSSEPSNNGVSFINPKFLPFNKGLLTIQSFIGVTRPHLVEYDPIIGLETPVSSSDGEVSQGDNSRIHINLFIQLIFLILTILKVLLL